MSDEEREGFRMLAQSVVGLTIVLKQITGGQFHETLTMLSSLATQARAQVEKEKEG